MIQKKICILGASAVGKTSLIRQFVEGIFSDSYLTSIGVKIDKKLVDTGEEQVRLMLWDIEGVDRYCGFNEKYLRGASAAIVVVDQTRPQSMQDGIEICRLTKAVRDIPVILVVNKSDLPPAESWDSDLSFDSSILFTSQHNTSAKTGSGVEGMFMDVAQLTLLKQVG